MQLKTPHEEVARNPFCTPRISDIYVKIDSNGIVDKNGCNSVLCNSFRFYLKEVGSKASLSLRLNSPLPRYLLPSVRFPNTKYEIIIDKKLISKLDCLVEKEKREQELAEKAEIRRQQRLKGDIAKTALAEKCF